ncbi:VPS54 domain-containing protein [Tanacetum coccineum]
MGRKMIKSTASDSFWQSYSNDNENNLDELEEYGIEPLHDEASLDYLCNLNPHRFEAIYSNNLPDTLSGEAFLTKYDHHNDPVTVIDYKRPYGVKAATRHPIYENFPVKAFKALLASVSSEEQPNALGELMYQVDKIRYFSMPYTLLKLVMVAVPNFSGGTMENYGLITYCEAELLHDDLHSAAANTQRLSIAVTHEVGQQWFGTWAGTLSYMSLEAFTVNETDADENIMWLSISLARERKLIDLVDHFIQYLDKEQALVCITVLPPLPVEYSPSPPSRFRSHRKARYNKEMISLPSRNNGLPTPFITVSGLKYITAKHLAQAIQVVSFVHAILPGRRILFLKVPDTRKGLLLSEIETDLQPSQFAKSLTKEVGFLQRVLSKTLHEADVLKIFKLNRDLQHILRFIRSLPSARLNEPRTPIAGQLESLLHRTAVEADQ